MRWAVFPTQSTESDMIVLTQELIKGSAQQDLKKDIGLE